MRTLIPVVVSCLVLTQVTLAQAPPVADETASAIEKVRDDMIDAFNKGDLDRLLSHVTPDATVTWQNGDVSKGASDIRSYYTKMMSGTDRIVKSVTASPKVDGRHAHGDWAVSWGHMNDRFSLTDGRELDLDSRFTAVLWNTDGVWKVQAFHLSTDAFKGAIMRHAIATTTKWAGLAAGGVGLLVGAGAGFVWGRRGRQSSR